MLRDEIKKAFGNATDLIVRPFIIDNREITLVMSEVLGSSSYVNDFILRRLLRRSVRYGRKLDLQGTFMYKLVDSVVTNMKDVYPYLISLVTLFVIQPMKAPPRTDRKKPFAPESSLGSLVL